jgi:enediyne biosynthesis protein E4
MLSYRTSPVILFSLLVFSSIFFSCNKAKIAFKEVKPSVSGIHFNNEIKEDEDLNILHYEYIYNGGGVGIGDFNNDSLPDIYFTGNTVANKLYINKGNMKFEDVTDAAGVDGKGKWSKGVSVIDINNDGMQDIYVSCAVLLPVSDRKNLLYINKGVDKKTGIPVFEDKAEEYGLADSSSTHMSAFFDYDNDGDLDVYLLVNELDGTNPTEFRPIRKDGSWPNTDKLLRNDWNDSLHHAVFTDVSAQAGILIEGYGLGVNITDINKDGWKDIYVTNDYLSNNHLYINNRNGTFTDRCQQYFKHTSRNSMGNDVADINNDGLADIIELDMAPADNYRLKMINNPLNYQSFQLSSRLGYIYQYPRNTLQLNMGPAANMPDSMKDQPVFSEVAYYAGIAHTDWSWGALATDLDNDGFRDLMVTNGLPKDLSDMDFIAYRAEAVARTHPLEILKQLPVAKISNYIYKNNGDVTFTDKTNDWGWASPSFSAGIATADFDRDGDLDVIINNTDMEASLYENKVSDKNTYLRIGLNGDEKNSNGIGSLIHLYYNGGEQVYENTPYRGYMSSIENIIHFGTGTATKIDSVTVDWGNAKTQTLKNILTNQTIIIDIKNAAVKNVAPLPIADSSLFINYTNSGINFKSGESDFIDFNIQRMLPHKFTQFGPSLAAGDLNGDGLDDFIIGGGSPSYATLYFQNNTGSFSKHPFTDTLLEKPQDDAGICLFDADNDNDLDIYIASGGSENGPLSNAYIDHFYTNDGKGNFTENKTAFVPNTVTKSCVKAADFDGDGDLDIFAGGRLLPGSYPKPVSSFLYRNDSKNGVVKFTDITNEAAPQLKNIGLVCDALWSDANNDGKPDLIVAGEWMPITVFENKNGKFAVVKTGIENNTGWWNSIAGGDLDNDGDIDYVAGNMGSNGFLNATEKFPLKVYGKDFDGNGSFDAVFSSYIPASISDNNKKEFPVAGRDDFIREMSGMKEMFPNYSFYAKAEMKSIFSKEQLNGSIQLSCNIPYTCWIENKGNMGFEIHKLPAQAQWAPIYGIIINDFDGDGNPDILLNGNEYSMAPQLGQYDALNGLLLKGTASGNFVSLSPLQSGVYIPGNGKALVQLIAGNKLSIVASENTGDLKLVQLRQVQNKIISLQPGDISATVFFKNGRMRKEELYSGSSFQSQSSMFILAGPAVQSVEIISTGNKKRTITN